MKKKIIKISDTNLTFNLRFLLSFFAVFWNIPLQNKTKKMTSKKWAFSRQHKGVFFFRWANFGPGRFYHWWVKVRKQKQCFIYLPHMYMISHWKIFAIKQIWFTNLSDNILYVLGSKSILSTIWPRTFRFHGGSILLMMLFYFGSDLILPRFNTPASQSHRSQSKRLNSTISGERKKFVVRSL